MQIMNIELLILADSAGHMLYNIVQAASRSHLLFMGYKQKYTLIEILGFQEKRDCMSHSSISIGCLYINLIWHRT